MKGRVIDVNLRKGMMLVEVSPGECSLVEILGSYDVNLGDEISGALESLGGETLRNMTGQEDMDVFIQDIHMSKAHGLRMIGN